MIQRVRQELLIDGFSDFVSRESAAEDELGLNAAEPRFDRHADGPRDEVERSVQQNEALGLWIWHWISRPGKKFVAFASAQDLEAWFCCAFPD